MLRRILWIGLVCLLGSASAAVPGLQGAHQEVLAAGDPAAPDPLTQPLVDGCQRYPGGLFSRTSPEWTYVYNTPASGPPPAPRWLTGTVSTGDSRYQPVHTSGGDLPFGHAAYDYNVDVLPDPAAKYLLGGSPQARNGNYVPGGEDSGRIHLEWEDLTIPHFAWAAAGDRVTILGSWVWDCGHWGTATQVANPDYILPKLGQPLLGCLVPVAVGPVVNQDQCKLTGESTEFHPYRALFDIHHQSYSSPLGESEASLFVSTDKTPAGVEADCAHANPPSSNAGYPPGYRACLATEPNWQDVSGDYSFLLPAPPAPSAGAQLRFRAVDQGSTAAPVPQLSAEGNAVRVRFRIPPAAGARVVMGYMIYAGWDEVPLARVPTHLRVNFDRLEIHKAMDPGCTTNAFGLPTPGCPYTDESTRANQLSVAPGRWNLFMQAGGSWTQWLAQSGELAVNDGDVLQGHAGLDIYVPPGMGWHLYTHGRECDLGSLGVEADCPGDHDVADDNDVVGTGIDNFASAPASVGQHRLDGQTHARDPTSTCPDVNPHGCYTLAYTVTEIDDSAARATASSVASLPNTRLHRLPPAPVRSPLVGLSLVAGLALAAFYVGRRIRSH
ncbi:MAG: hypothetical protein ACYDGR_13000 [Candidatus Dormibacteria bacterium]